MKSLKLKKLSAAMLLLTGWQGAHALTPWGNGAPPEATTFVISGGAAQDLAFAQVIKEDLAEPGSLDVFGDATTATSNNFGARWTVYYFRGKNTLGSLAGQPIAVVKRSLGAAGYGVIPLIADTDPVTAGVQGIELEELDISTLTAATPSEPTTTQNTVAGVPNWRVVVNAGNAATLLPLKASHGGIIGIDAKLLLRPGTKNYPTTVPRVGAGSDTFPSDLTDVPAAITQVPTGGLVYGVGVTTDFYKVLQAAQVRAGQLPADTVVGDYEHEANIPSLGRNFVGSLFAGKVQTWDQVKIVDRKVGSPTFGTALPLTDPSIRADAGVNLPNTIGGSGALKGQVPVAVGNRNAGAAIGAVGYAVFLNYPWTVGAFGPGAPTNNAFDGTAAPIIKDPGGTTATGNLLNDWNQGTNVSTLNGVATAKRWGIAINSGDRNTSGTVGVTPEAAGKQNWRYVRIDGWLPKIENVASGNYPVWAEGVLLYDASQISSDAKTVLDAIANGLGSPTTANVVNNTLIHTWGKTGIFALTNGTSFTPSIPFDPTKPVVGYTHKNGNVLNEIVPVVDKPTAGVLLQ